ncbi:CAP domain-containing protein [Fredinandcohnia humi]
MQRFTKLSMIILSSFLLVLTACNTGDEAQNVDENRSAGIQKVNNGYITNEDRPYRTSTSSDKYPHTSRVQHTQGQRQYFRFINKRIVTQNPAGYNGVANGNQQQNAPSPQYNTAPTNQQGQPAQPQQQPAQQPAPTNQGATGISQFERQVIDLTNTQRKNNGLPALQADTSLSNVARTKSNDMRQKNYFSHTSPTYGSPFDMMRDFGVSYKTAGENIAKGQTTPQQVVNAWMNSEGHRKNILNPNFTHIGVGHDPNGNYWTQMFIGK